MATTSIIVTWDKMGPEFTYSVYYSKSKEGPWIRHHDFRLTDEVIDTIRLGTPDVYNVYEDINIYTIDGLQSDTEYHVKVSVVDKYYQRWYNYTSFGSAESAQEITQIPIPTGNSSVALSFTIGLSTGFGHGLCGHTSFGH